MSVSVPPAPVSENGSRDEKAIQVDHVEQTHEPGLTYAIQEDQVQDATLGNLVYSDEEEEPVLHARTWFAVLSLFLLNYVQVLALTGPPEIVSPGFAS